jgi:hypothetical protein
VRTVVSFMLRLLAALLLLSVIVSLGQDVGPLETATLLITAALLAAWSVRLGRPVAR